MGVVVTLAGKQMMTGGAQKVDPRVPSSHARQGSPSHWWMPPKRRCRPGPSVLFFVSSTFSASLWVYSVEPSAEEVTDTRFERVTFRTGI